MLKPFYYTTRQGILGKRCSEHIIENQSNTKTPTRKSGLYKLDLRHQSHPLLQVPMPANYEGRTESHEQLLFACELGTADEGEYGGRWNQLLCSP